MNNLRRKRTKKYVIYRYFLLLHNLYLFHYHEDYFNHFLYDKKKLQKVCCLISISCCCCFFIFFIYRFSLIITLIFRFVIFLFTQVGISVKTYILSNTCIHFQACNYISWKIRRKKVEGEVIVIETATKRHTHTQDNMIIVQEVI